MDEAKRIAQVLHAIALVLEKTGFPKDTLIAQGHPQDPYCFFLALWRSKSDDRATDAIKF